LSKELSTGFDGRAGRDDLVDAVEHRVLQGDPRSGDLAVELLHGPRPDDRGSDRRMLGHEADRELDQGEASLVGEPGELLDGVQLALVARLGEVAPPRSGWRGRGVPEVADLALTDQVGQRPQIHRPDPNTDVEETLGWGRRPSG
jgi:hypothetical protein